MILKHKVKIYLLLIILNRMFKFYFLRCNKSLNISSLDCLFYQISLIYKRILFRICLNTLNKIVILI